MPSEDLKALVKAKNTPEWQATLRAVLQKAYSFIPGDWEQLTADQLSRAFREYTGRSEDALNGAQTFFIAAAVDAGIRLTAELALRGTRARGDYNINFGFHNATPKPGNKSANGSDRTNGAVDPNGDDDVAQVWSLVALIDDASMTEKEKTAVLTLLAYLKRRRGQRHHP